MNVPAGDIEKWRARLGAATPSVVLREMAEAYGANKSALGFMVADLYLDVGTPVVQAVWKWDINRTGRGLSDADLDELLSQQKL
ncbi:hypothetical protein [Delftia sp. PS-11]|uniref:hypothetical protein n=1 Tax=Delftia sp. PS-11 TaxID=2767222 RepID=UPI0024560607|nr:hypothetical protein [Delftia sp. PS-11]KAJ8744706.1 hypothetical protein H9T68_10865 [Delftia sp. PS-11]